jgi:hypothetical protein
MSYMPPAEDVCLVYDHDDLIQPDLFSTQAQEEFLSLLGAIAGDSSEDVKNWTGRTINQTRVRRWVGYLAIVTAVEQSKIPYADHGSVDTAWRAKVVLFLDHLMSITREKDGFPSEMKPFREFLAMLKDDVARGGSLVYLNWRPNSAWVEVRPSTSARTGRFG